jgi:hypothetical protein
MHRILFLFIFSLPPPPPLRVPFLLPDRRLARLNRKDRDGFDLFFFTVFK